MVSSESPPASADQDPAEDLDIRAIQPGDNVAGLSLGHPDFNPLKSFLRREAHQYHSNNIAKTYVIVPSAGRPTVRGYISLMCSEITLEEGLRPDDGDYRYPQFPSVKIARLAVDRRYSGLGLGSALVQLAVATTRDIMPVVGCRFLIVDAKRSAVEWYQNRGFILYASADRGGNNRLLYIDLQKVPEEAGQAPELDLREMVD